MFDLGIEGNLRRNYIFVSLDGIDFEKNKTFSLSRNLSVIASLDETADRVVEFYSDENYYEDSRSTIKGETNFILRNCQYMIHVVVERIEESFKIHLSRFC